MDKRQFDIMAEDEDGASNKNSSQNPNNEALSEDNEQCNTKPDLGIEETKYNSSESDEKSSGEAPSLPSSECSYEVVFCPLNIKTFPDVRPFLFQSRAGRLARKRTHSLSGTS